MKKKRIILMIILLPLMWGCKSTKTATKTAIRTNDVVNVDTKTAVNSEQRAVSNTQIADKGTVIETTDETTTTTQFSAPDSTGKQYPMSVTTTNKTTRRGENKDVKKTESEKVTTGSEMTITEKMDAVMGTKTEIKDKKQEVQKSPSWVSWSVIALLAGLSFLVYLVLKKYRIL